MAQTDGAPGLDGTLGRPGLLPHVGCWVHAGRKFVDALRVGDTGAQPYLDAIGRLFQIDARARRFGLAPAPHQQLRARRSVPLLEALFARAAQDLPLLPPKSDLAHTLAYLLAQRAPLKRCVTTLGARLDNNLVENSIRPIKLGEANWLFIGGVDRRAAAGASLHARGELPRGGGRSGSVPPRSPDAPLGSSRESAAGALPHVWHAARSAPPLSHAA